MAGSKPRPSGAHHRKRYGHHQKQTKPFLKTYLPYLPLLVIVLTFVAIAFRGRPQAQSQDVLAYATSVESSSLLDETNAQRAANGQPPLKLNSQLISAATAKANDMAARNYWSHVTPDNEQPWSFFDKVGYAYQKAGENLAYGFTTSKETISGWMNSPTHKANLLDPVFDEVGFGFANAANYQNAGPETIVVALYGHSQLAAATAGSTSDNQTASGAQAVRGQASTNFADIHTYRIAKLQIITNGRAPWALGVMILAAAIALGFVVAKHTLQLHRLVRRGERFVIAHPLFDITLVAFIALSVYVSHTEGYILAARF